MKRRSFMVLSLMIFLAVMFIGAAAQAQSKSEPEAQNVLSSRETLSKDVEILKGTHENDELREKIIGSALTQKPAPAIPEEAKKYLARGKAAIKTAKDETGFREAAQELENASKAAPWVASIYYNLGIVYEDLKDYSRAIKNYKFYLIASPKANDAEKVQEKIYELEFSLEKEQKEQAAMSDKYGGQHSLRSNADWDYLYRHGGAGADIDYDEFRKVAVKIVSLNEHGVIKNEFYVCAKKEDGKSRGQPGYSTSWRGVTGILDDKFGLIVLPGDENIVEVGIVRFLGDTNQVFVKKPLMELFRERAKQAVYAGSKESIEGKTNLYVMICGGLPIRMLFFPASIKNHLEDGTEAELTPQFVVDLQEKVDGKWQYVQAADIGIINNDHWYLDWDHKIIVRGCAKDYDPKSIW